MDKIDMIAVEINKLVSVLWERLEEIRKEIEDECVSEGYPSNGSVFSTRFEVRRKEAIQEWENETGLDY